MKREELQRQFDILFRGDPQKGQRANTAIASIYAGLAELAALGQRYGVGAEELPEPAEWPKAMVHGNLPMEVARSPEHQAELEKQGYVSNVPGVGEVGPPEGPPEGPSVLLGPDGKPVKEPLLVSPIPKPAAPAPAAQGNASTTAGGAKP